MKISTVNIKEQNYVLLEDGYHYLPTIGKPLTASDLQFASNIVDHLNENRDKQKQATLFDD